MNRVHLTEENVAFYEDYIPEDMAENIGRSNFRGLVLTEDGTPRAGIIWRLEGYLAGESIKSRILWLCVDDEDTGSKLFSAYRIETLTERVSLSCFEIPAKRDKTEKNVLIGAGFTAGLMEGDQIVARLSELNDIDFIKKTNPKENVMPLRNMSRNRLYEVLAKMNALGFHGRCEDIELLPRLWFDQDVSCYLESGGETNGLFLCHLLPSGRLIVELMAAVGKNYVKILPYLICRAVQSANEIYPPDTQIIIDRHNYALLALGEKLFPRGFGTPVYVGEREETI